MVAAGNHQTLVAVVGYLRSGMLVGDCGWVADSQGMRVVIWLMSFG